MNTDTQNTTEQTKTWLTPESVQDLRNRALSGVIATRLQDRNLAFVQLLASMSLWRDEFAHLNVEYLELEETDATMYILGEIQKRLPDDSLRGDQRWASRTGRGTSSGGTSVIAGGT